MSANENIRGLALLLPALLLAVLAGACAGAGPASPGLPAGTNSLAAGNAGAGMAPVAPPAAGLDPAVAEGVGRELPMLRGVPGDDQLRTLRWMLTVPDERRLVSLYDDLRNQRDESIDRRAAEARVRLEALAQRLEAAGHRAPEPSGGPDLAQADPNAPEPDWFPPSLLEELAAHPDDPEAVKAFEKARRTTPRGTRPPG